MVRFSFSPGGKQSRRDRPADEEKTRRRNFGFLKTGDKRTSSLSTNRTREHPKQLPVAMGYSDPAEIPTSSHANQELSGGDQEHFDPFENQSASISHDVAPNARASGSMLGRPSAVSAPSKQEREPTTSTQDSFDTASVGSANGMEFFSSRHSRLQLPAFTTSPAKNNRKKQGPSLDQFVENTRSHFQGASSYSVGGDSLDRNSRERSVISMPTIPTNSSMQANFARRNSSESPGGAVVGAAARRRMRNQMRQSSSANANSFDDLASQTSTPPESPASSVRYAKGSSGRNRLAGYQRGENPGFYSRTPSTNNSLQSGTDLNYTPDAAHQDWGFTFDGFGLDPSAVEREMNEDIQGEGTPVLSNADSDFEFPSPTWGSPPSNRRSSPFPSDSEQLGFVDGFGVAAPPSAVRQTHPGSSPVSSENTFSSPKSQRVVRSQAKGVMTPPRWENQSAKKMQPTDIFDQPMSNPWKEDPWGSGDEEIEFSDSDNNSDFGGTKSEGLVSSLQPQPRYLSDERSDVGVPAAYQKSVSFHEDVVVPNHLQNHQHCDSTDDSSDSLHETLAQEFAQEFVDSFSPRHNEIPTQDDSHYHSNTEQTFPQGTSQYNGYPHAEQHPEGFQVDAYYDSPHGHDDHARVEESQTSVRKAALDRYGSSEYGAHRNANDYAYSTQPHGHRDSQEPADYGPVRPTSYRSGMGTAENRFRSFRSKYESSKDMRPHDESVDHQQETQIPVHAQNSSHEYGTLRNSYAAAKAKMRSPGPAIPRSGQSAALPSTLNPNTYSDYGPVTDKNVTPTNASETDFDLSPDNEQGGEHLLGGQHTRDNESTFHQTLSQAEEAKDDTSIYSDYGPVTDKKITPADANETGFVRSPDENEEGEDLLGEQCTIDNEPTFNQTLSQPTEKKDDLNTYPDYGPVTDKNVSPANTNETELFRDKSEGGGDLLGAQDTMDNESTLNQTVSQAQEKKDDPSTYADYGPVTDKNVTPADANETDFVGSLDKDEGGEDLLAEQHTMDNESMVHQNLSRAGEKKDDDDPPPEINSTANLKLHWLQWEAKSQMKSLARKTPVKPSWMKATSRASQASKQGVEMPTPEVIETRRVEKQENQADAPRRHSQEHPSQTLLQRTSPEQSTPESQLLGTECQDERKSFSSPPEILHPEGRDEAQTRSDADGCRSPMAADMVDRLQWAEVESQSDTSSPGGPFLESVTMEPAKRREDEVAIEQCRNTASPHHSERPLSYGEEQAQQQTVEATVDRCPQQPEVPLARKLTYRERREQQLKREQEAKAKLEATKPKEEQKKDVAALIRKRVAANKQKNLASPTAAMGNANTCRFPF